jgi:hypothetical protein
LPCIRIVPAEFRGKFFYINAHILCFVCTYYTVPKDLRCGEVGRARCEFAGVMYEVAAGGDADSIGVWLLRTEVDNDACVGHRSVFWDGSYLFVGKDEDGVGTGCVRFCVALCLVPKFLAESVHPDVLRDGVLRQLLIAGDKFSRCRMNDRCTEVCHVRWAVQRRSELVGSEMLPVCVPCFLCNDIQCFLRDHSWLV